MAEKILQTRILNKVDSYENYLAVQDSFIPRNGEICIATVSTTVDGVVAPPQTLIKVGDGVHPWGELKWLGAVASDVHAWAKSATKPIYNASEIQNLSDYISGQIQDTDTQYQLVQDGNMGIKLQSRPKTGGDWTDVGTTITLTPPTYELTTGATNGTVAFNGTDVKIKGLASAAYAETSAFDAAGSSATVKSELLGTAEDTSAELTIHGIKAYASQEAAAAQTAAETHADEAIAALDVTDTAVEHQFVTQVSEQDGKITVKRAQPAVADISGLEAALGEKQDNLEFTSTYDPDSNKVVLKNDLDAAVSSLAGAMHFVGVSTTNPATGTVTIDDKPDYSPAAGDVVLYEASHKEYVYDGEKWVELGDESSYAVKGSIKNSDIAADAAIDQSKIANLTTDLSAKASQSDLDALEALMGETSVANQISVAIGALETDDTAIANQFVTEVDLGADGLTVKRAGLTADAIPSITSAKISDFNTAADARVTAGINTAIADGGAIDTAVDGLISTAIAGVAGSVTAEGSNVVKSVSLANGVLTGTTGTLGITDVSGLQDSLNAKANDSDLATIAKTGNVNDLVQNSGDVIVFSCGSATVNATNAVAG